VAKLNAYAQRNQATNRPDINGYVIGGSVPMGPGLIRASYSRTDNDTANTNQFALGYVYNFSKLTQMYATLSTVRNDGYASAALTPGLNGGVPSLNGNANGVDFGIAKRF
jgi:predicted porin